MADDTPGDELTLEPTTVVTRPRRRALWGALAAVAVAAGALVVSSSGGGDDGERPLLPVALGALSGADSAAGLATPTEADTRMAWITYVAGEGLPALGGEGAAYRLAGDVDEARVRALAAELGLQAEPTQRDRYWHVEDADGVLEVFDGGGGSWWYSQTVGTVGVGSSSGGGSAGCEGGPAVDCAVDVPLTVDTATTMPADECADGGDCTTATVVAECGPGAQCSEPMPPECAPDTGCVVPPPIEPTPPADLPTKDEARQIALDLLTATGMDVEGARVTVDGPYDAWYVTVEPVLDGVPVSGWISSVGVGSKGVVTNAAGTLGQPEALGAYPLIDTRAAVDRLNDQEGAYATLGVPDDAPASASEGCATEPDGTERCWASGTAVACAEPAMPPARDHVTTTIVEPCPAPAPQPVEPEPMEVVLARAERVLVLLPSLDGTGDAYLLPGYRFSGDDGAIAEVAAVADESLAPTTTTAAPVPAPADPVVLGAGEEPELGVGYYVDNVNTHCGTFVWADRWWATDAQTPLPWSYPTEGGTFTLTTPDEGTFVGDHEGTKTAVFTARGPAAELPGCA